MCVCERARIFLPHKCKTRHYSITPINLCHAFVNYKHLRQTPVFGEHKNKCHYLRHPVCLFQRLPARFPHTSANASTFSQASFFASWLLFWSGKRNKVVNMNNIKITKHTKLPYSAYCSTAVKPGPHTPCMRRLNTFRTPCL